MSEDDKPAPAPVAPDAVATYEVGYGKPPVHTRWKKGCPSPNPHGVTRAALDFKKACQEKAPDLLRAVIERMTNPDERTSLGDMVRALEVVCDRAGFLATDKAAAIEMGNAKVLLAALAMQQMDKEERQRLIGLLETQIDGDS